MEQLTAQAVGWEHATVGDERIDRTGLPFADALFSGDIPIEVDEAAAAVLPPAKVPIDRISRFHVRSYELGSAAAVIGVWQDQYGNTYTSLSYKGSNYSKPDIIRSLTAPSGFIPYGLQEDDVLLRIIKSSQILRENGIPTEWIVGVTEPPVIPFDGALVSQLEYKKRLLERTLGTRAIEEVAEIAAAIEPMAFFVTKRCMEINDRPSDFLNDTTPEKIRQRLQKIFTVYNMTHREDPEFRELQADSDADCLYYFAELLPMLHGRNLARLHNIGLVHTFPVTGNVTALGGVIDLDSIRGAPLGIGDPAITFQDMSHDFSKVFEGGGRSYTAILKHLADTSGWFTSEVHETLHHMQQNFLNSYHETSSREFSKTEQCLVLLDMNRTAHRGGLASETLQRLTQLLSEYRPLLDSISGDLAPLVERDRMRRAGFATAYAERQVDMAFENNEVPANESEIQAHFRRLHVSTLSDIEAATAFDCIEMIASGEASEAFNLLVDALGLTGKANADMREVLARALLAPHILFGLTRRSDHMVEVSTIAGRALNRVLSAPRFGYWAMNIPHAMEQQYGDDKPVEPESLKCYSFHRFPYQIITSMDWDGLQALIEAEKHDNPMQIHFDPVGDDAEGTAIAALPITQYVTDASEVSVFKEVTQDGEYRHVQTASKDQTYVAAITVADEAGTIHILVQSR